MRKSRVISTLGGIAAVYFGMTGIGESNSAITKIENAVPNLQVLTDAQKELTVLPELYHPDSLVSVIELYRTDPKFAKKYDSLTAQIEKFSGDTDIEDAKSRIQAEESYRALFILLTFAGLCGVVGVRQERKETVK